MNWLLKNKIETPQNGFPLQDVSEPNLYRDIFPYDDVPRLAFDGKDVPIDPPDDIWITCTTFRDGQQARPPYSVKQVVDIYDMLHRLGGPNGVIRQCEFFLYREKDKEAVRKCLEKNYQYPEVTAWIRAVKQDFNLVKEMGLKETGILTSASDYHIFKKLGKTRKQALDSYLDIVKTALESNVRVRCHLEDITRADFFGFIMPFAIEAMKLSKEAKIPVRLRLCDTMGYGVPFPQATLPRSIPKMLYYLVHEAGVPKELLEWHGHNDFHKVLINAATAWLYGCAAANGTLLGFGERTGNPPIEALIIEYIGLKGSANGIDTRVITEMANYFRNEIGVNIPNNYPFVGSEFNTTSAGIHADGVLKDEEIYNIFNTRKILNRPPGINITDKSGLAGIAFWIDNYLDLNGDKKVSKQHPGIAKIEQWVTDQYKAGRTTSISTEEMISQTKQNLPEFF